ncbi:MAG: ABC transporter ATP-binding protein [Alphaproteobacteria bacterium]|nr:ABC transporter ATP-binding protein [Alphaproteobacteria bacterium]
MPPDPILEVDTFSVSFVTDAGRASVVEDVSFSLQPGETVGLVGESGCGKSVTAMSIMRLIPSPPSHVEGGSIRFQGNDLLTLGNAEMRAVRGDRIGMIFQEPMTSLNPTFSIGYQIAEVFRVHRGMSAAEARCEAIEILSMVGIGAAERRIHQYPHELSGGLRQRAMIAMALACRPDLLIADEPTTALDVTVQAQILDLLRRLQAELGMSVLLITHDLGVVAEICERVFVMYAGRIVESAAVETLFRHPLHPYTTGLLASSPRLGMRRPVLPTITGMVPAPDQRGPGCYFADRCQRVTERCRAETPPLAAGAPGHAVACWNPTP